MHFCNQPTLRDSSSSVVRASVLDSQSVVGSDFPSSQRVHLQHVAFDFNQCLSFAHFRDWLAASFT